MGVQSMHRAMLQSTSIEAATFFNNLAEKGGALYLNESTFSILPNATVLWENNHAKLGGAVYTDNRSNPFVYCSQANICTRKDFCEVADSTEANNTSCVHCTTIRC